MRVVLLNQFFWPDSAATSQLLTDLARGLRNRGHDVCVLCASGGYALQDKSNDPKVEINRVRAFPFGRGRLGRALSYLSFFFSCAVKGLLLPRPDLVITLTTPPLLSLIGTLIKAVRGSEHYIWEMDLYPDVAVDLNYIKAGGFLDRLIGAAADFSRRKANGILALGDCMRNRLLARGILADKIHVVHNWADGKVIRPIVRTVGKPHMTVLYSGNFGLAHEADTIVPAMLSIQADPRFRFVFAGGGSLRRSLEARCRKLGLSAVEFRPYSHRDELGKSLGNCDIGLVMQRASCAGSVVPSKVYGLMAAGRPILFIGPAESTVADIITRFRCGWRIENGDSEGLVSLLQFLAGDLHQVEAKGKLARKAFEQHYDLPLGVARICSLVGASVESPQSEVFYATASV